MITPGVITRTQRWLYYLPQNQLFLRVSLLAQHAAPGPTGLSHCVFSVTFSLWQFLIPSLSLLVLGLPRVWHFLMIRLNLSIFRQEHRRNDVSFFVHDIGKYTMLTCLIVTGGVNGGVTLIIGLRWCSAELLYSNVINFFFIIYKYLGRDALRLCWSHLSS